MAVFLIYGSHWGSLAYTQDPIHSTTTPFAKLGGANGAAYNSSQGFHNVSMFVLPHPYDDHPLTSHPGLSHPSYSSSAHFA